MEEQIQDVPKGDAGALVSARAAGRSREGVATEAAAACVDFHFIRSIKGLCSFFFFKKKKFVAPKTPHGGRGSRGPPEAPLLQEEMSFTRYFQEQENLILCKISLLLILVWEELERMRTFMLF